MRRLIIVLIVGILLVGCVIANQQIKQSNKISKINTIEPECDLLCQINSIAMDNSLNSSYKLFKNDCTHYSTRLVDKLKDINVTAYCVLGVYLYEGKEVGGHVWVRAIVNNQTINIEATPNNAGIIDNDESINYRGGNKVRCWKNK